MWTMNKLSKFWWCLFIVEASTFHQAQINNCFDVIQINIVLCLTKQICWQTYIFMAVIKFTEMRDEGISIIWDFLFRFIPKLILSNKQFLFSRLKTVVSALALYTELMKQQFVVIHRFTTWRERKTLDRYLIDQHLSILCFLRKNTKQLFVNIKFSNQIV